MGIQAKLVSKLPRGIRHFPLDFTFVLLGVPSSVLSLFGLSRSPSLAAILPVWAQIVWSITLLIGCLCWGVGVLSTKLDGEGVVTIRQVPILVFGLSLVSVACLVLGIAILVLGGWSGVLASVPLLAVAFGTYLRRINLSIRLQVNDGN